MSRYAPRPAAVHYSFGPGPITPAVKWLIIANVAMFLATWIYEPIILFLGLTPRIVIEQFWIWQLATYAFLHGGAVHILFNMLGIWMFGVELERLWGTRQFVKYYAITGVGAGLTVLAVGLVLGPSSETYRIPTIGASGALYGLLVAFAYYYPDRPLLMFFLTKLRVIDPVRMARYRKYVLILSFIIGAMITPTPDPMNQTLVSLPIYLLFELGLLLSRLA